MQPQAIAWQPINQAGEAATNTSAAFDINAQPLPELVWKPLYPTAEVVTVVLAFILTLAFALIYWVKARRILPGQAPTGYVLMVEMLVVSIEKMTIETLGERYRKLSAYFLTLLVYITLANFIGLVGLSAPTNSLTFTFAMGLVMYFGTIYFGFKHQRLSFIQKFMLNIKIKGKKIPVMINPIEIVSEVSPLLSISMRLWGNLFAGTLVMSLLYALFQYLFAKVNPALLGLSLGSIFGGLITPVFHGYFDVLIATLQAYVFVTLNVIYWGNQMVAHGSAPPQKAVASATQKQTVAVALNH